MTLLQSWTFWIESNLSQKGMKPKSSRTSSFEKIETMFGTPSAEPEIWINPELFAHQNTANLDYQPPATLYFLGLVKDVEKVVQVYVEELNYDRRKHWVVLSERDYDAMDEIYDIEENTLDTFPLADLEFRVTVMTEQGPSISPTAKKIFDRT